MRTFIIILLLIPFICSGQQSGNEKTNQFILFDVQFTFTKEEADHSTPNKSHIYVTEEYLNSNRPKDWTTPVDFRNGIVHIRIEVIDKPAGNAPTKWTLCYIPNLGKGNGYGCTGTDLFTEEGISEKDVSMTDFWENESIIWSEGVKRMDLVIKDDSGGQGHAHKREDHELFFPTTVRISMVQVAKGATYNQSILPEKAMHHLD